VFRELRLELEAGGLLLECYRASRTMYPSGMSLEMGGGRRAYKLTLGQPGRLRDLVDVFATGPDVAPAPVEEQEAFDARWCASIGARGERYWGVTCAGCRRGSARRTRTIRPEAASARRPPDPLQG